MTNDDSMKYDDFIERFNLIKSDLRRRKVNSSAVKDKFDDLITELINNENQEDSKRIIRRLLMEEFNWTDEDALSFTNAFSRVKGVSVQTLVYKHFDLYNCIWLLLVKYLTNKPVVSFELFESCLSGIIFNAMASDKGCYSASHSSVITFYENEVRLECLYRYKKSWKDTVGDSIDDSSIFNTIFGTDLERGRVSFKSAFENYLKQHNYSNIDISSYEKLYELMVRSCDYMDKKSICLEQIKKYLEEGLISIDFTNFTIKTTDTSRLKKFSDIKFIYIYSMRYDTCGFVSLKELSKLIFPFDCSKAIIAIKTINVDKSTSILKDTYDQYIKITDTLLEEDIYLDLSFIDYLEDNDYCPLAKMEVESHIGNIIFTHSLSDELKDF